MFMISFYSLSGWLKIVFLKSPLLFLKQGSLRTSDVNINTFALNISRHVKHIRYLSSGDDLLV